MRQFQVIKKLEAYEGVGLDRMMCMVMGGPDLKEPQSTLEHWNKEPQSTLEHYHDRRFIRRASDEETPVTSNPSA